LNINGFIRTNNKGIYNTKRKVMKKYSDIKFDYKTLNRRITDFHFLNFS